VAALNTTTFAYALKTLYSNRKLQNLAYKRNPWFAACGKDTNFRGANFVEALIYGHLAGAAGQFTTAQANKAASKGVAFTITRTKDYALASIDTETILSSRGNEAAFLTAVKREMDSAIHAITRSMAKGLYGDGSGTLGIQNGAAAANVVTLTVLDNITNFEVGMKVVAASPTSGLPTGAPSTAVTVNAVDRDLGKLTLSDDTGFDDGDHILREGDYVSASDRNMIYGLGAWLPYTAESSGTFFGVDRTTDVERMQGHRIDGSALNIDEAVIKMATRIAREGGQPDCAYMSYEKWEEFVNLLGAKVQYETHTLGEVGFQSLKVQGPAGPISVYADQNCPSNRCYVLTKDTWRFRSLGQAPQILNLDGLQMMREYNADAYEIRVGFFGNLCCNAPGYNGVLNV
jgi:hypothetical protein